MELHEDDLFHACSACAGTGRIMPPEAGGGALPSGAEPGAPCDKCGGKGSKLTDTGMVLRAFVQMIQDGKL
jgi:hypothetical protein